MKIQEHIDKISWSLADKVLFVVYGFIEILFQIRYLSTNDYGLYTLLRSLVIWIFVVCDSLALQSIIQFGANRQNRRKVNTIAFFILIIFSLSVSILIYFIKYPIAGLFNEPRLVEIADILPLITLFNIPRAYCNKFIYRDQVFKNLFFIDLIYFGVLTVYTFVLIYLQHSLSYGDMVRIYLISTLISSILSIILTRKDLKFGYSGNIKIKTILNFGVNLTLGSSLHSILRYLDGFLVKLFFSTSIVGIYQSAKMLFRLFDEAGGAASGLIYPAAIRQIENKNYKGLSDLMTKSVSFIFVLFAFIVIVLELGAGRLFITTFFPYRYHLAIDQFNILILAALFMPFNLLTYIITAMGKPQLVLKYVAIALVSSIITFYFVGKSGYSNLIPLGIVIYNLVLGGLSYLYINRTIGFPPYMMFRAISDSKNFINPIILKIKKKFIS